MYLYYKKYNLEAIKISGLIILLSGICFSYANLIRQGIAAGILVLAKYYYDEKKMYKFFICVLLALSFHKSAILFPIFLIIIKKIKVKNINAFYTLLVLYFSKYFISYNDIFKKFIVISQKYYPSYTEERFFEFSQMTNSNKANLGLLLIIILFFMIRERAEYSLNLNGKLCFLGLVFRIFSTHNFILNRIGLYFDIFFIIYILDYFSKKNKSKIIKICVVGLLTILFLNSAYFKSDDSKNNYKNVLTGKIGYK